MVHSLFTLFLVVTLAVWSDIATAACDTGLAERMLEQISPKRVMDHGLSDCKSWSSFTDKSLVVLPLQHAVSDRGGRSLDVELLLVQRPDNGNTERDRIVARLLMPELLVEDARLHVQELHLDTGRYRLTSGHPAFGLRVLYRGQDEARPYFVETLRLFVVDRQAIRPVMDELVLRRDSGEWDLSCSGRFEELRTQLTVQALPARQTGAWADLVLRRSQVVRTQAPDEAGACQEHTGAQRYTTEVLKAVEGRYPIPQALRAP